jgi:ABC-type dipeptide/oligopeptide/nickel transport system ATPase component
MIEVQKYNFSFTAGSLRFRELEKVIKHLDTGKKLNVVEEFGGGKSSTGKRVFDEIKKRYSNLTEGQRQLYLNSDSQTQRQLAFLAVCKTFSFIRDFVVEVIRDKALFFDYQLSEGEYLSFFRRKQEHHEEIDALSEETVYKVKQVTFKILEQAGIINNIKEKQIQPQFLFEDIKKVIVQDNPQWLKVFLLSDMDIENSN